MTGRATSSGPYPEEFGAVLDQNTMGDAYSAATKALANADAQRSGSGGRGESSTAPPSMASTEHSRRSEPARRRKGGGKDGRKLQPFQLNCQP
jgi:hypothetical protein